MRSVLKYPGTQMRKVKKVMLVFGTRPEAIKMAPLYHRLRANPIEFDVEVCVTGQHRQMLDQVLETFEIQPTVDLDLMTSKQSLFDITANSLLSLKTVLKIKQPDLLLVHGDTSTTMAAAVAGFYSGIDVCHVEAGLRTFDISSPFPEEFNRQVVSKIAKWHFAPTDLSRENLINEGVDQNKIIITGNTVIDALHWTIERTESRPFRLKKIENDLKSHLGFDCKSEKIVLITCHRRENLGLGVNKVCKAIRTLAEKFKNIHYVFPVHMNPKILDPVQKLLGGISNIHLIQPLEYEAFVYLLNHSHLVLTDSGGIQEEAPSLGKPVLVMRNLTERPEAVRAGAVKMVGTDESVIIDSVAELLIDQSAYEDMARSLNPYGDGKACDRIVGLLQKI